MECTIDFSLRDSVVDLENPSHPSHNAWYKALTLLRRLGMNKPGAQYGDMSEYSYCCVKSEDSKKVMYLYRELCCLVLLGIDLTIVQHIARRSALRGSRPAAIPRCRNCADFSRHSFNHPSLYLATRNGLICSPRPLAQSVRLNTWKSSPSVGWNAR